MIAAMKTYCYDRPDALSPAECAAATALADVLEPATMWSGEQNIVKPASRSAQRRCLTRPEGPAWLYQRVDALFAEAAGRFELAVDPVFEPVQIVRYDLGDHFQLWHSDAGTDRYEERLVSMSIELSDPGDHDGGVLEIAPAAGRPRTLQQGGAKLFLSRAIHRVTPVTRGVRWALVAWTGVQPHP